MEANLYIREIRINKADNNDCYPFNIPLIENLDRIILNKRITFIIGENGSGKSTLAEAIAIALGLNPDGGSRNFLYDSQEEVKLEGLVSLVRGSLRNKDSFFLRSESLYNLEKHMQEFDNLIYGNKKLNHVSRGESILHLIEQRFYGSGIYILDEPESALSPTNQLRFMCLIHDLAKNRNSQFIISTHSPLLISMPDTDTLEICDNQLEKVNYQDTSLYTLYQSFLRNNELIKEMLED